MTGREPRQDAVTPKLGLGGNRRGVSVIAVVIAAMALRSAPVRDGSDLLDDVDQLAWVFALIPVRLRLGSSITPIQTASPARFKMD